MFPACRGVFWPSPVLCVKPSSLLSSFRQNDCLCPKYPPLPTFLRRPLSPSLSSSFLPLTTISNKPSERRCLHHPQVFVFHVDLRPGLAFSASYLINRHLCSGGGLFSTQLDRPRPPFLKLSRHPRLVVPHCGGHLLPECTNNHNIPTIALQL